MKRMSISSSVPHLKSASAKMMQYSITNRQPTRLFLPCLYGVLAIAELSMNGAVTRGSSKCATEYHTVRL